MNDRLLFLRDQLLKALMTALTREDHVDSCRGVARVWSWGACDPPLVGLLLGKQPTIFRWRKCHDNILAVKAIVEKPTFLKFVFCKVFSSMALVFS